MEHIIFSWMMELKYATVSRLRFHHFHLRVISIASFCFQNTMDIFVYLSTVRIQLEEPKGGDGVPETHGTKYNWYICSIITHFPRA